MSARTLNPQRLTGTGPTRLEPLRHPIRFAHRLWNSSYRPAIIATGVAALLAWVFLLLPPMNTDMAAQLARADFASSHPFSIIDFRWFGGTVVYGYTLWAAALMAALGTKVTGAIAAVLGTWYATRLLHRLTPPRPLLGGLAVALTQVANVVEGRITFACGLTCGLVALTLLTTKRLPRWLAITLAVLFSLLSGGASPVAALLLWLCGTVAVLMRKPATAVVLLVPSAAAVAVISLVFGDGGRQPFSFLDCLKSLVALAIVLATTPQRCRPVRIGALVGMAMLFAAFILPTPVGSNATRLTLLFALPVAAAFIHWRSRYLTVMALAVIAAVQLPINPGTLASTDRASGYSAYYTPVISAVHGMGPLTGRIEVPEMSGHWDAVYLARGVPLARGWLRQTDVRLNDAVFYQAKPTPTSYLQFLIANAVQYVAVPDAALTTYGHEEADLIATSLPYLSEVWHNAHWQIFAVSDFAPVIAPPGTVLDQSAAAVVVSAPPNSTLLVRVRWYRWLGMESSDKGACIRQLGLYISLHTGTGGNYTFNSGIPSGTGHCPD